MKLSIRAAVVTGVLLAASVAGYAGAAAYAPSPSPKGAPALGTARPATQMPAKPDTVYVSLPTACRLVDTTVKGGAFAAGEARSYLVAGTTGFATQGGHNGGCGVPNEATAVTVQVTALDATAAGSFAFAAHGTQPGGTAASFTPGQATTSGTTQAVTPGGGKELTAKTAAGGADLRLDVTGYYEEQIQAFVNADGTVFSQTNRILSVTHPATGQYFFTLDSDVVACSLTATAESAGVTATGLGDPSEQAEVDTFTSSGPVDAYFNVTITC